MQQWIVIGAGSAGCVLGARLSADSARHVIVLDDGPSLLPREVPASIDGPNFLAALDEPGRAHDGLMATRTSGGVASPYQRGRGVGGSSAVNAMVAKTIDPALCAQWGWIDADVAASRVQIPSELAAPHELGAVDRALLAACPEARPVELTRRDGRRCTAAEAYLWPVADRPNLDVWPDSRVDRIRFAGNRAVGVRLTDGTEIPADRVVVAAGAIHSPAILLRSGLEVPGLGRCLQDHPSVALTLQYRAGRAADSTGLCLGSLLEKRIGDDTIQLLPMNHLGSQAPGFGLLMVALMTPTGMSGTVTIDAAGDPVINFDLLDDQRDLDALVAGVRLALDVVRRQAFTEIVDEIYIDGFGTTADSLTDDASIAAWIRVNIADYVHATGTCGMGRVVDEYGAVKGHADLYVCDASVFPSIPDVNTHIPTTLLAELLCARGMMTR
ncbi:MAG: choline dehydrogenase-like flavoprotein [Ilumatobacter sp.]|jgi:choline dehydrogenase-like flavoprotein